MAVPSPIPYEELRFEFAERTSDGFPFKCNTLQGELNGIFRNPLTQPEVEQALANVDRFTKNYVQRDVPRESLDPVQDVGSRLFSGLFAGPIAGVYRAAVDRTASTGGGIRLRFTMHAPDLIPLPWEFLYDIDRRDFIALSAQISLVRESAELTARSFDIVKTSEQSPIRALIIDENPTLAYALEEEIAPLRKLEKNSLIELRVMRNASRTDCLSEVEDFDYDAIMFTGAPRAEVSKSGEIKPQIPPSVNEKVALQEQQLVTALSRQKDLRLLYLSDGQTDLLAEMLSKFVPVTIGIRGMMTDGGRIAFTNVLFKNAIEGQWLDAAISHARRAIDLREPGTREWGMPVCYTSVAEGLRLRAPRQEESPSAAIIETADGVIISGVQVKRRKSRSVKKSSPVSEEQRRRLAQLQTLLAVHAQNLDTLRKQAAEYETPPDFLQNQVKETEVKFDEFRRQIEEII